MESQRSIHHPSSINSINQETLIQLNNWAFFLFLILRVRPSSIFQYPELSTSSNYPSQQIAYTYVTKDIIPAAHSLNKWGNVSMATIERNVPPKHKWLSLMKILLPLWLVRCNPQRKKKPSSIPPTLCLQLISTFREIYYILTYWLKELTVIEQYIKINGKSMEELLNWQLDLHRE